MPKETTITNGITAAASSLGWLVKKDHGGYGKSGWPDLFLFRDGKTVCIEVKQPGKKPTPLQVSTMNKLESKGIPCFVCTSKGEAVSCLDRF